MYVCMYVCSVQENDRIARHYDAQEVLNKELNRLRNQSGNAYDDSNLLVSPSSPPPYPLGGAAPGRLCLYCMYVCMYVCMYMYVYLFRWHLVGIHEQFLVYYMYV